MSDEQATLITIDPERTMAKAEAEMHRKAIIENSEDSGARLLKLKLEKGYQALGFDSFEAFGKNLDETFGSIRTLYRLMDQAMVNRTLSLQLGKMIHLPVQHALAIKDLEPAQQVEAYKTATSKWAKGKPRPTEKDFKKAAHKIAPEKKKKKRRGAAKKREASEGWSAEEIKKDKELSDHLLLIESVYGPEDAKAIRNGTLPMQRADVIFLGKLPKENMLRIQDLLFTTRWAPKDCVKFINTEPDDNSTVEDLKHLCLATNGKYWTGDFDGFSVSVKLNRAVGRK